MANPPKVNRSDAQAKKLLQAEEGRKAMLEYEAERASVRAKTERLRALRLAKEAEAKASAAAAPAPAGKKKKSAKAAPAAKTLSAASGA